MFRTNTIHSGLNWMTFTDSQSNHTSFLPHPPPPPPSLRPFKKDRHCKCESSSTAAMVLRWGLQIKFGRKIKEEKLNRFGFELTAAGTAVHNSADWATPHWLSSQGYAKVTVGHASWRPPCSSALKGPAHAATFAYCNPQYRACNNRRPPCSKPAGLAGGLQGERENFYPCKKVAVL